MSSQGCKPLWIRYVPQKQYRIIIKQAHAADGQASRCPALGPEKISRGRLAEYGIMAATSKESVKQPYKGGVFLSNHLFKVDIFLVHHYVVTPI
jgi:hypothetical protein